MKKKILITGISGFIGKAFERFIRDNNLDSEYNFIGVDSTCSKAVKSGKVHYITSDFSKKNNVESVLKKIQPSFIINLIGLYNNNNFDELIKCNVIIPGFILETCQLHASKIEKILLIGSAAESEIFIRNKNDLFFNPSVYYGLTKFYQQFLMKLHFGNLGLPVLIAKTYNLTGKNCPKSLVFGKYSSIIRNAKNGKVIYIKNLKEKRDFIDVDLAVIKFWKILMTRNPGKSYKVASGKYKTIEQLLNEIALIYNKKIRLKSIDNYL